MLAEPQVGEGGGSGGPGFHWHSHSSIKALSFSGILSRSPTFHVQLPGTQIPHASPATTLHVSSATSSPHQSPPTEPSSSSRNAPTISHSKPPSVSTASWLWTWGVTSTRPCQPLANWTCPLPLADSRRVLALQGCCFKPAELCLAVGILHCKGVASFFWLSCPLLSFCRTYAGSNDFIIPRREPILPRFLQHFAIG